jgi:hypothetical protein
LEKCCISQYGPTANPKWSLQSNFNVALKNTSNSLSQQPSNLLYHNLCSTNKIPTGTRKLLGLNLKFCLASNKLQHNIKDTILKMASSI